MRATDRSFDALLEALEAHDYSQPRDANGQEQHCDLVMKGGITSGVVYPLAVLQLAQSRRFHSIGGTSAGAIAAAVTAAAEYGRAGGGFNELARMVGQLQRSGFIANLFQPTPELRPLMRALFIGLKLKRRWTGRPGELPARLEIAGDLLGLVGATALARKQAPALIGGVVGVLAGFLLAGGWLVAARAATGAGATLQALLGVLLIVVCWWVGNLLGTAVQLLGSAIPGHFYGICDGMPVPDHASHQLIRAQDTPSPALTDWLAREIDRIAGVPADQPLTFGLLRHNHQPEVDPKRRIELNVVTTNLSQGQPYTFPFNDTQFLFSEQEFRRQFPAYVVDHMVRHASQPAQFSLPIEIVDPQGQAHTLRFLPPGDQLPIIVGTRMSLSFPLLLSAVPLWTISAAAVAGTAPIVVRSDQVRRNWFSDGGICCNFPIHFYDRLFPTHPTFGINLEDLPSGAGEEGAQPYNPDFQWQQSREFDTAAATPSAGVPELRSLRRDTGIYLPTAYPQDRPRPVWQPLDDNLGGFLGAILNTGLFYRDIMQSRLPSYYDRIATVFLGEKEGGLNLDMPPATIKRVAAKGQRAGLAFDQIFDFDHHRWVRLRLLLSKIEEQLIGLRAALGVSLDGPAHAAIGEQLARLGELLQQSGATQNAIQQLIDAELAAYPGQQTRYPYPSDRQWRDDALGRLYLLLLLIETWGGDPTAIFQLEQARQPSADVRDDKDHIRLRVTPDL